MPSALTKTAEEIKLIQRAGRIVAGCHQELRKRLVPGKKTKDIDRFIDWYLTERGATSAQKGYKGYPYTSCISINEVACHGFPNDYELKEGDIVTVDIVADLNGWKADSAWTYMIGNVSEEARKLVRAAKAAMNAGIKAAKVGNALSAIGQAIEQSAAQDGFKVVSAFAGHGIGRQMHERPQVLHTGKPQPRIMLEEGMVITIEPILSAGSANIYTAKDGWTTLTVDHALTAQFEHTIAITNGEPLLLTALPAKQSNARSTAAKPSVAKTGTAKSSPVKTSEAKSSIVRLNPAKTSEAKSSIVRSNPAKTSEARSSIGKSEPAKPSEAKASVAKANSARSSEPKPFIAKTVNVKSSLAKPADDD